MIKRCGYVKGCCLKDGGCDFYPNGFGDLLHWGELQKKARRCKFLATKARAFRVEVRKARRRRDWKVGNPYDKDK